MHARVARPRMGLAGSAGCTCEAHPQWFARLEASQARPWECCAGLASGPSGDQKIDGGAWDGSVSPGGPAAGGTVNAISGGAAQDPTGAEPASGSDRPARILGAWTSANQGDAGAAPQPSSPGTPPIVDPVDTCSACASGCDTSSGDSCATAGDDGGDSCDASADDGSSADSCSTASSDSSDACSAGADSGAGAGSCQISRGHGRKSLGTRLWLLAPLAFLLLRRRS